MLHFRGFHVLSWALFQDYSASVGQLTCRSFSINTKRDWTWLCVFFIFTSGAASLNMQIGIWCLLNCKQGPERCLAPALPISFIFLSYSCDKVPTRERMGLSSGECSSCFSWLTLVVVLTWVYLVGLDTITVGLDAGSLVQSVGEKNLLWKWNASVRHLLN